MKEFILLSAAAALVIMTSGCGVVGTSNNGSSGTAPAATEASTSAATEIIIGKRYHRTAGNCRIVRNRYHTD